MDDLKPLKLHDLLAGTMVWSDELWASALVYLLERTSTPDVLVMAEVIGIQERPWLVHKIDYLRGLRDVAPTVLLGAFDWMRYQKAARQRPHVAIEVEQRPGQLLRDSWARAMSTGVTPGGDSNDRSAGSTELCYTICPTLAGVLRTYLVRADSTW